MSPKEKSSPRAGGERYNVLYIMTDQHCFNALSCAGHPLVKTPRIDELARDATMFENAYCPSPLCAPGRASLFTGHYPARTGVLKNHQALNPNLPVLPEQLRQSGMQTALVGKLHFTPRDVQWGFEHFLINDMMVNTFAPEADLSDYMTWLSESLGVSRASLIEKFTADRARSWYSFYLGPTVMSEPYHHNAWVADESIRFLTERRDGRPFFLFSSFFGPHQPMLPPEPWASLYRPQDVELIPQFHADTSDKEIYQARYQFEPPLQERWPEETYRKLLAAYYGQITQIDYHVGRVLDVLKAKGLYDKTLIIFTADHGDHNGQFRMLSKSTMYENSAKVPFIVRDPGAGGPMGQRLKHVVNNLDAYRTILRRCGLDAAADSPSRDLTPILRDPRAPWVNETRSSLAFQTMIRRDNWKLMRYDVDVEGLDTAYELYNLDETPYEMVNHYHDPQAAKVRQELQADLDPWHAIEHPRRLPHPIPQRLDGQ